MGLRSGAAAVTTDSVLTGVFSVSSLRLLVSNWFSISGLEDLFPGSGLATWTGVGLGVP